MSQNEETMQRLPNIKTIPWLGMYEAKSPYTYVNLAQAKRNPEYWSVVQHIFEKQIARTLVSNYRKKIKSKATEEKLENKAQTPYVIEPLLSEIQRKEKIAQHMQAAGIFECHEEIILTGINKQQITPEVFSKLSSEHADIQRILRELIRNPQDPEIIKLITAILSKVIGELSSAPLAIDTATKYSCTTSFNLENPEFNMFLYELLRLHRVPISDTESKNIPEPALHEDIIQLRTATSIIGLSNHKGLWSKINLENSELNLNTQEYNRTLLRFYKLSNAAIKSKKVDALVEDNSDSIRFIKEPVLSNDIKVQADMTQKIKAGEWNKLDFDNKEFPRHLYRLLRLRKISKNELLNALLLHEIRIEHREHGKYPAIRQFSYEDKQGPYGFEKIADINYIMPDHISAFQKGLPQLNRSEQCYFSINLSHKEAVYLIYYLIYKGNRLGRYEKLIQTYFARHLFQDKQNAKTQEALAEIKKIENLAKVVKSGHEQDSGKAADPLLAYLRKKEPADVMAFVDQANGTACPCHDCMQHNSVHLYRNILVVLDQLPTVELSPDFKIEDPNTPLLAEILMTPASYFCLNEAIHGKDALQPHLVAGKFGLRYLKHLEEKNERPVEITHPDIHPHKFPHGFRTYSYRLTWHDLFHIWRTGAFPYKSFTNYLNCFLEKEKGYDICKGIEMMLDKDTNIGRIYRAIGLYHYKREHSIGHPAVNRLGASKYSGDLHQRWKDFIGTAGKTVKVPGDITGDSSEQGTLFDNELDKYADNLLLIIDMIINQKMWQDLLGSYFQNILKDNTVSHGYDLELMSSLPENDKNKAVVGKIYLSNNGKYIVRDLKGIVHEGSFDLNYINGSLADKLKDKILLSYILEITSTARHILNRFQFVYSKLDQLIKAHPMDKINENCYIFYILLYKLSGVVKPENMPIIATALQRLYLKRLCYWTRNDGLAIYPDYLASDSKSTPTQVIDNVHALTLFDMLNPIINFKQIYPNPCNEAHLIILDILHYRFKQLPNPKLFYQQLTQIKPSDLFSIFKIKNSDKKLYIVDPSTKKPCQHSLTAMKINDIYNMLIKYKQSEIQALAESMKQHPEFKSESNTYSHDYQMRLFGKNNDDSAAPSAIASQNSYKH